MKVRYALLTVAALLTPVFAGETTIAQDKAPSAKKISGALQVGYSSNYTGRGYVITHSVAEGDSAEHFALKLSYDIGAPKYWSFDSTVAYTTVSSGHTLYGNPTVSDQLVIGQIKQLTPGISNEEARAYAEQSGKLGQPVKTANIENEFAVITAARYTREKWNVAFGHDFIHGGLLGVMAKHYRDQGASCVNEVFITPTWTPTKWFELGVTTRYSFQGITGWWFEPQATFKAPVIGPKEAPRVAALLTFAMSATADYFQGEYFACKNGSQAFWIKLSTPIFLTEARNLILTPSVSFNWAGKGAMKANENSEYKKASGDPNNTPFRNFGVVAGVSCTYTF